MFNWIHVIYILVQFGCFLCNDALHSRIFFSYSRSLSFALYLSMAMSTPSLSMRWVFVVFVFIRSNEHFKSFYFFVWVSHFFFRCTSVVVPVCKLSFLLLRLVAACYIFIFDCFNTASPAHRGKNTDGKSTEPAIYCCELSLSWILFSSAACTLSLFLSSFFLPSTDTYVCVCVYIYSIGLNDIATIDQKDAKKPNK